MACGGQHCICVEKVTNKKIVAQLEFKNQSKKQSASQVYVREGRGVLTFIFPQIGVQRVKYVSLCKTKGLYILKINR